MTEVISKHQCKKLVMPIEHLVIFVKSEVMQHWILIEHLNFIRGEFDGRPLITFCPYCGDKL